MTSWHVANPLAGVTLFIYYPTAAAAAGGGGRRATGDGRRRTAGGDGVGRYRSAIDPGAQRGTCPRLRLVLNSEHAPPVSAGRWGGGDKTGHRCPEQRHEALSFENRVHWGLYDGRRTYQIRLVTYVIKYMGTGHLAFSRARAFHAQCSYLSYLSALGIRIIKASL